MLSIKTTFYLQNGSTAGQGFQPVVDGELILEAPILMRERGDFNPVPEMIGLTSEDGYARGPDSKSLISVLVRYVLFQVVLNI